MTIVQNRVGGLPKQVLVDGDMAVVLGQELLLLSGNPIAVVGDATALVDRHNRLLAVLSVSEISDTDSEIKVTVTLT
jgi:hypothetical protein